MAEIDCFFIKFKNLCVSGRNASLKFETKAGKVEATLQAELGDVPLPPTQLAPHHVDALTPNC